MWQMWLALLISVSCWRIFRRTFSAVFCVISVSVISIMSSVVSNVMSSVVSNVMSDVVSIFWILSVLQMYFVVSIYLQMQVRQIAIFMQFVFNFVHIMFELIVVDDAAVRV